MKKLIVHLTEQDAQEMLMAWMGAEGISDAVYGEEFLEIYFDDALQEKALEVLSAHFADSKYELNDSEEVNWNAEWEASFQPVVVGKLRIRATFHEPLPGIEEIIISPRMAFGTGHHETTFMMLDILQNLNLSDKAVLDYGCGTGILSVMSAKQGVKHITAIDIQEEACENTNEHFSLNGLDEAPHLVLLGDLNVLDDTRQYDLILANINKGVIRRMPEQLFDLCNNGGALLVSGILKSDYKSITELYLQAGFAMSSARFKGEWSLMAFNKLS